MNTSTFRQPLKWLTATLLLTSVAQFSHGHGRYVLPSHTQVSGDEPQSISLTASISNDLFHPDKPLGNEAGGKVNRFLQGLFDVLESSVILPDGTRQPMQWRAFQRFSAADLTLEQSGTHRVQLRQPTTHMLTFQQANGERDRRFGPDAKAPDGATNITRRTIASTVVSYVSHNQSSAPARTGEGLELGGGSHPNDLFAGEEAHFTLTLDGKALTAPAKVHFVQGGTRHRNQRDAIELETSANGAFSLPLKHAGMHWLEVEYSRDGQPDSRVDVHHHTLYVTLEVFAQ